jgi:hypothetical protein
VQLHRTERDSLKHHTLIRYDAVYSSSVHVAVMAIVAFIMGVGDSNTISSSVPLRYS